MEKRRKRKDKRARAVTMTFQKQFSGTVREEETQRMVPSSITGE